MVTRLLFSVGLFIAAFILPWWLTVLITLAALFYFPHFYEAVCIGLILDAVYGSYVLFSSFSYAMTLAALILVFMVTKIRERMIMY